MSNCKVGDMAEYIGPSEYRRGHIFEVIAQAGPGCTVTLPNGKRSTVHAELCWVVKAYVPVRADFCGGGYDYSEYGVCLDSRLRPIRQPEQPVTTDVPEEITA